MILIILLENMAKVIDNENSAVRFLLDYQKAPLIIVFWVQLHSHGTGGIAHGGSSITCLKVTDL